MTPGLPGGHVKDTRLNRRGYASCLKPRLALNTNSIIGGQPECKKISTVKPALDKLGGVACECGCKVPPKKALAVELLNLSMGPLEGDAAIRSVAEPTAFGPSSPRALHMPVHLSNAHCMVLYAETSDCSCCATNSPTPWQQPTCSETSAVLAPRMREMLLFRRPLFWGKHQRPETSSSRQCRSGEDYDRCWILTRGHAS